MDYTDPRVHATPQRKNFELYPSQIFSPLYINDKKPKKSEKIFWETLPPDPFIFLAQGKKGDNRVSNITKGHNHNYVHSNATILLF